MRNGKRRYLCTDCNKWFSIDRRQKNTTDSLWIDHIDGKSYRSLANETGLSAARVYGLVESQMNALPDNTWLSKEYCNRWSGILHVDGKYIAVKGYKKKIPFIWSVDYLRHDFPIGLLAPSESEEAFMKFFRLLKTIRYPLQVVIADDVPALKKALFRYYPKAKIQLCHTHYIENIRQTLKIRTESTYQHFFNSLLKHVFTDPDGIKDKKQRRKAREDGLLHVFENRLDNDPVLQSIVVDIAKNYDYLFAYDTIPGCPKTNNILESFNSHVNGRLKTIKGFQSFKQAERWLNAYLIRRRTKPFTDCNPPFTHFNGKMPLQNTLKKQATWPAVFGIPPLKKPK